MAAALTVDQVTGVFLDAKATLERVVHRRLGCRETAQDITQDLFLKIDRLIGRFHSEHDARCFLIRMAINAASDRYRVDRRRAEIVAALPTGEEPADPAAAADMRRQMQLVEAALDELPQKCREVLYLARIQGLTHAEIAIQLGVSRSLVDKYATRALLHCRQRLSAAASSRPALS